MEGAGDRIGPAPLRWDCAVSACAPLVELAGFAEFVAAERGGITCYLPAACVRERGTLAAPTFNHHAAAGQSLAASPFSPPNARTPPSPPPPRQYPPSPRQ